MPCRRRRLSRVTPQKNGVMSERETEKSKINAYLLDVLSGELEEANRYAVTDPFVPILSMIACANLIGRCDARVLKISGFSRK